MRRTELKADRNGVFTRNIGWIITKSGKRSQPKFYLGEDRREAERRLAKIVELWEYIEQGKDQPHCDQSNGVMAYCPPPHPPDPFWDDFALGIAKQFAAGHVQIPVQPSLGNDQQGHGYALRLNALSSRYPMVNFIPSDPELFQKGRDFNQKAVEHQMTVMRERGILTDNNPQVACDGSLHQAFNRYADWIKREYFNESEGGVSDNGMTKVRQIKTIKERCGDKPLATVGYFVIDEMFGHFRKRPPNKRTGKPMSKKSCQNYIGELSRFFDWLDLTDEFSWHLPERYSRIRRNVDDLESDVEKDAAEVPTFTVRQLAILNEYATPIERLFLLLGLNCAYGADQLGRLRTSDLRLSEDGPSNITRIRRKKKVLGRHRLWRQTVEGLRWALDRRPSLVTEGVSKDVLILNGKGQPYWRKTKGDNRCRDIPNTWYRLVDRVRVDYPAFPRYSFNCLRDTSIHFVRQLAGEAAASLHATHKHQSADKHLRRYSNPRWKRLFRVHRRLERKLEKVFAAAPEHPFEPQPQAYISRGTVKKICELHSQKHSIAQIATEVGVSEDAVRRKLQAFRQDDQSDSGNAGESCQDDGTSSEETSA
jgi:hypothetical protein